MSKPVLTYAARTVLPTIRASGSHPGAQPCGLPPAEAVVLSVLGGVVGRAVGAAGNTGIARLTGWPRQADLRAAAVGFGFAVLVGLFFGVYSAYQASRLEPVVALRSE